MPFSKRQPFHERSIYIAISRAAWSLVALRLPLSIPDYRLRSTISYQTLKPPSNPRQTKHNPPRLPLHILQRRPMRQKLLISSESNRSLRLQIQRHRNRLSFLQSIAHFGLPVTFLLPLQHVVFEEIEDVSVCVFIRA